MKLYCFVPVEEAAEMPEILNRSLHTDYSQCTVIGDNSDIYIVSFEADSVESAPAVYHNYRIYTADQVLTAMWSPERKRRPAINVKRTMGDDFKYGFDGQAAFFTCAAGGTANADFLFTYQAALKGGYLYAASTAAVGDYCRALIVDTENTLGLRDVDAFGLGTGVIHQFLMWYAAPGHVIEAEANDVMELPAANLTVRLEYHSTGLVQVKGFVNLKSYKVL